MPAIIHKGRSHPSRLINGEERLKLAGAKSKAKSKGKSLAEAKRNTNMKDSISFYLNSYFCSKFEISIAKRYNVD